MTPADRVSHRHTDPGRTTMYARLDLTPTELDERIEKYAARVAADLAQLEPPRVPVSKQNQFARAAQDANARRYRREKMGEGK